jgi:adenosyl cobinamide kinase/adenosyl cobinamide phosphate guanylyltransferase
MNIVMVTGGARSGKSRYVETRARALAGEHVSYIATAIPSDDDMRDRIAKHRASRPPAWETLEPTANVAAAIRAARHDVVILDCITMLAAHAIAGPAGTSRDAVDAAIGSAIAGLVEGAASREGTLLTVTNEVGMSIHPPTALGLWFQDALGRANQQLAKHAREVVLMVSGVPVVIKRERE